jgi:CMP-N-acetylneuraminic acid synthetase
VLPAIRHAIECCEADGPAVSVLVFLQTTVPFRTGAEIAAAVALYREGRHQSVISVCPLERKPHNIFVKQKGASLRRLLDHPALMFANRQDMGHLCRLGNGVYVTGRDDVMAGDGLTPEPIGYVESDRVRSLDIDDDLDLMLARGIAAERGF